MARMNDFIAWYNNEFKFDSLFAEMNKTHEGTPWHREVSVGTHTDMVVSEYIAWANRKWTDFTILGALACAFHDTGKPSARVVKYKPERGNYNSFGGHEIISARLWEDYACRNWERIGPFLNNAIANIYRVGFIIEHHMPYEIKSDKIADIGKTVKYLFPDSSVFSDHLTADTHGRIADDHEDKIARVDEWIKDFEGKYVVDHITYEDSPVRPTLYMPVAASGSGKSTNFKQIKKYWGDLIEPYSWDDLRLKLYNPDYKIAYQMSVDDSGFNNKAMKAFNDMLKTGKSVYVDNTNLSRKRRAPYLDAARKSGYNTVAFLLPVSLQEVLDRQHTRGDKNVPESAVRQHYMSLQLPLIGEFDRVEVSGANFYK